MRHIRLSCLGALNGCLGFVRLRRCCSGWSSIWRDTRLLFVITRVTFNAFLPQTGGASCLVIPVMVCCYSLLRDLDGCVTCVVGAGESQRDSLFVGLAKAPSLASSRLLSRRTEGPQPVSKICLFTKSHSLPYWHHPESSRGGRSGRSHYYCLFRNLHIPSRWHRSGLCRGESQSPQTPSHEKRLPRKLCTSQYWHQLISSGGEYPASSRPLNSISRIMSVLKLCTLRLP